MAPRTLILYQTRAPDKTCPCFSSRTGLEQALWQRLVGCQRARALRFCSSRSRSLESVGLVGPKSKTNTSMNDHLQHAGSLQVDSPCCLPSGECSTLGSLGLTRVSRRRHVGPAVMRVQPSPGTLTTPPNRQFCTTLVGPVTHVPFLSVTYSRYHGCRLDGE